MRRSSLDFARTLARKADNDWRAASVGLEHDVPLDTVCFHLQQTAEKLIKALLECRSVEYRFTHDLKELLRLALPEYPVLGEFRDSLPNYTDFATAMRYEDSHDPDREQALEAFETVKRFRTIVHSLLPPEARP
jgi:HEPN domain-containing protein